MPIKQLSLFVENRPGSLNAVCQVLKKHNLSIRTLSLADTQQFGILRLLVREHEEARRVLEEAGFVVKITDVLALTVPDCPGGLADILTMLSDSCMDKPNLLDITIAKENAAWPTMKAKSEKDLS